MIFLSRRTIRKFSKNTKAGYLPKSWYRYKDDFGRDNGYIKWGRVHSSSDDNSELQNEMDYDYRLGYDYSSLNIRNLEVMPDHGMDQFISARTIEQDKQNENDSLRTMELLEGQNQSTSLTKKENNEKPKPNVRVSLSTLDWETQGVGERNSVDDHREMSNALEELSSATNIEDKKNLIRNMVTKDFNSLSTEHVNQMGQIYDQRFTYNSIPFSLEGEDPYSNDERSLIFAAETTVMIEEKLEKDLIQTGKEPVYRGDPDLWTPVAFNYPQSEKDKVRKGIMDYEEPQYYKELFKESRRRIPADKKPEQKPYLKLPLRTQYED